MSRTSRRSALAPWKVRYDDARRYRQPRTGDLWSDWLNVTIFLLESSDRIAFDPARLPDRFPISEADGTGAPTPDQLEAIEEALAAFYAVPVTAPPPEDMAPPELPRDGRRKLTEADVCRIRNGGEPSAALAIELGVHRNRIAELRRGIGWTDLDCDRLAAEGPWDGPVEAFMDLGGSVMPSATHWDPAVFGLGEWADAVPTD